MGRLYLRGGRLLDPEARTPLPGALLIEDGRIRSRLPPGASAPGGAERVELGSLDVAPGFIDLHFHGSLIFAEGRAFRAALRDTAASLLRQGTTAFLATTLAWPAAELSERVACWAAALAEQPPDAAQAIGLHLEGPWIHPDAAGAQPGAGIRACSAAEAGELLAAASGSIRMVTLAPERPGAAELLALLARRGVVAALGHSLADAAQVADAVARGASHVTHLFNAMGGFHQRAPGLAGAALADARLSCDLICDGAHVHAAWVRTAARALGERLALITDRVEPPAGAGVQARMGGTPVHSDGVAIRSADGRLAGSCLGLDRALRNLRDFTGASPLEAVAACTLRPARVLGIEAERGSLRPGARADFAVLDRELRVRETWIAGRRVYRA